MREGVDPNKNNSGQTLLSLAAWYGYAKVVKALLMREEANPDKPDNCGQTPLSFATRRGHFRVAALLQSRKLATPGTV